MTSRCDATTRTMPGAAVIELTGEVDGTAADVLTAAYQAAVAGTDVGIVVLDFASVVYINSTGIALIVSINRSESPSGPDRVSVDRPRNRSSICVARLASPRPRRSHWVTSPLARNCTAFF